MLERMTRHHSDITTARLTSATFDTTVILLGSNTVTSVCVVLFKYKLAGMRGGKSSLAHLLQVPAPLYSLAGL